LISFRYSWPVLLTLTIFSFQCSTTSDSASDSSSTFRAGFSALTINPTLIETEWTDHNDNGRFDGAIDQPVGDPADCGETTCLEPFNDSNGNGIFDAVWMAGFSSATPMKSIHDDIWTRCLAVEKSGTTVAICTVDLIGYFKSEVDKIRARLVAEGVDIDYLVVNSTHNHQSPDTMGIWGPNMFNSGVDPQYMELIVEKTVEAAQQAIDNMVPAKLTVAAGDTKDAEVMFEQPIHFREGLAGDYRDPIITNQTMTIMQFKTGADNSALGTVLHWSNHPEMMEQQENAQTSDYPHYIRERLEEKLGGTAIYWTGALGGLITPHEFVGPVLDDSGNPIEENGAPVAAENRSWEQLRSYGTLIADFGIGLLESAEEIATPVGLTYKAKEIFLPVQNSELVLGFSLGIMYTSAFDESGASIGEGDSAFAGNKVYALTEVGLVKIGPVAILTLPGEIFPENWIGVPEGVNDPARREEFWWDTSEVHNEPYEISIVWKPLFEDVEFPIELGLANDEIGYIVPHQDYDNDAPGHYEESRCLGPRTERMLDETIRELLASTADDSFYEAGTPPEWPED
jgi:Neutral/alkaline non-lysosomal ceramidase, N-terminal